MSFRPDLASQRRAPHVLVMVLFSMAAKDIILLGCSKVPPGQRSQEYDSSALITESRKFDIMDGKDVGLAEGKEVDVE